MNKTISFFYVFSISCFMILLFINMFSFDWLTDVPILLSFDKDRTRLFNVNYFILLAAMVLIYAFVALLSLNIMGSGLNDEAIATIRKLTTIIVSMALLLPFIAGVLAYCGAIGSIMYYVFDIVFVIVYLRGFNEEQT